MNSVKTEPTEVRKQQVRYTQMMQLEQTATMYGNRSTMTKSNYNREQHSSQKQPDMNYLFEKAVTEILHRQGKTGRPLTSRIWFSNSMEHEENMVFYRITIQPGVCENRRVIDPCQTLVSRRSMILPCSSSLQHSEPELTVSRNHSEVRPELTAPRANAEVRINTLRESSLDRPLDGARNDSYLPGATLPASSVPYGNRSENGRQSFPLHFI